MQYAGSVRNRLKIEGAVHSAKAYLEMKDFSAYWWDAVGGKPICGNYGVLKQIPPQSVLTEKLSKDLKRRGFKFVGPTIIYAIMQACGLYHDHLETCHRNEVVKKLARK